MIYTREGVPVKIVAYHGKVKPKWAAVPVMLVKVEAVDTANWSRFRYVLNLCADGGINEIEKAVDAAPKTKLCERVLREAMEEAE